MPFLQTTRWLLKCDQCNSETDIGVRPGHLTTYDCKNCKTQHVFAYPAPPETPQATSGSADSKSSSKSTRYWTPGLRDNVVGGLWTAGLLALLTLVLGGPVVSGYIKSEVKRLIKAEREPAKTQEVNTSE